MSFKPNDSQALDDFCQEIIKITNCSKPDIYKFIDQLIKEKPIIPKNEFDLPSV